MSDYDYIITVDENGSPCLQHALFGGGNAKGSQRQNHKYYARAQDKGRWRYFYSPEEFRAWSSGATRKVKQAINNAKKTAGNAAGEVRKSLNARRELNEANKATGFGSGLKQWNAQRKYNKTAMGKAEKAVRETADDLGDRARGLANRAGGRARQAYDETRNKLGANASDAVGTARKKIKNLTDAAQEHGNKTLSELRKAAGNAKNRAENAAREAGSKAKGAASKVGDKLGLDEREALENANFLNRGRRQKAYDATPMGKAENAVKGAADRVRDTANDVSNRARDRASEAANRVKDTAGNLRDRASSAAGSISEKATDIRNKLRDLADSAESTARGAADKARNAAGDVTGSNAKKKMDAAGRAALMGLDDVIGEFTDSKNEYEKSLGGRASKAVSDAEASMKATQAKAKKALAKALDYLPDEQINEIKDLISDTGTKARNAVNNAVSDVKDKANKVASERYEKSASKSENEILEMQQDMIQKHGVLSTSDRRKLARKWDDMMEDALKADWHSNGANGDFDDFYESQMKRYKNPYAGS